MSPTRTISRMTEEERSRYAKYRDQQRGGPPRAPKPHGTSAAVLRHRRAKEPLCEACAEVERKRQADAYQARKAKASPGPAKKLPKKKR